MARSYYETFWEAEAGDSFGEQSTPPSHTRRRRRWSHSGDTGGVSSGGPDGSSGYESEEKQSAPRRDGWDGWAEDGSWYGGSFSEAFGTWRGRRGFNENWSWKSDVEPDTTIKDDPNDEEIEDLRGKVKVVGGQAGPERKGTGKVSNTYPPVFRAKPQESYQEWKRSVEFWIGGEGEQLPVELIGPRMMVQLKDRAAQLVKHLNINDVNGPNGKQIIFKELEKSPLIKQVDRHRVDEHRRRLMQLNRAPGESMESYVTRAGVYRSHLLGVDPGMAMGEAFYVGHLLDHAKLTKRDRAMIKTKAGGLTDEEKVTSAMIELASEMDGESGFPVGASEPNLARNGEEWLLQRDRALRGAFLAEADEESVLGEDFGGEADGPEADAAPPELLHLEHEAFGTQFKARQKIAEVRKLRQYYQKPDTEEKKKWLTEQMKKNPCHACGQLGHWSRECPMKAQQVLFAKSRAATSTPVPSRVATIPEEDEGAEWALLASLCSKGAGSLDAGSRATEQYMGATGVFVSVRESATKQVHTAFSTVSMGLYDVCWSMQQLAFKVILDIGCMRSVVGVRRATEVLERWKAEGRWHRVEKENEAFRFGDGEVLHSRYRMEFIGSFAGKPVVYGFSVVEGVCPPLFSRSGCTQLGVVIDCEHHSISSRRLGIKSFGLGRAEGHYTLCIDDSGMDVAAIDLPRDFRLGAGMDAMSICSEVLPEKPEKPVCSSSDFAHGSSLGARAQASVQTMQVPRPQVSGLPDAAEHLGRGGLYDGDRPRGGQGSPPAQGQAASSTSGCDSYAADVVAESCGQPGGCGELGPDGGGDCTADQAEAEGSLGQEQGTAAPGVDRGEGGLSLAVPCLVSGGGAELGSGNPQPDGDLRLEEDAVAAEGEAGHRAGGHQALEAQPALAGEALRQGGGSTVGTLRGDASEDQQPRRVAPDVRSALARPQRGLTQKMKKAVAEGQKTMEMVVRAAADPGGYRVMEMGPAASSLPLCLASPSSWSCSETLEVDVGWGPDFQEKSKKFIAEVREQKPDLVIIRPVPWLLRAAEGDEQLWERRRLQLPLWHVVLELWKLQDEAGRLVVLSQPVASEALFLTFLKERREVLRVVVARCAFAEDGQALRPQPEELYLEVNEGKFATALQYRSWCQCPPAAHARSCHAGSGPSSGWPARLCRHVLAAAEQSLMANREASYLGLADAVPSSEARIWETAPVSSASVPEENLRKALQENGATGERFDFVTFEGPSLQQPRRLRHTSRSDRSLLLFV